MNRPAIVERILIDMDREAFDGFRWHDNDAPMAWRCNGCDAYRKTEVADCPNCESMTDSWIEGGSIMEKADRFYWSDHQDRAAYQTLVL